MFDNAKNKIDANIVPGKKEGTSALGLKEALLSFLDDTKEAVASSKFGISGSITTSQELSDLDLLPNGIYEAQTSGVYKNGLTAKEGYYTLFRKDENKWSVDLEIKMPVQDLSEILQRLQNLEEIFGDDSLTLYITSTKGDLLDLDDLNTTLVVSVDRYFKDVTDEVISWQWTRESGLSQEAQDADEIWKIGKTTKDLVLTPADFTSDIFEYGHTFICTALLEGNKTINGKITI